MTSVKWLGQACIVITHQSKEKQTRLVMDPYGKDIGITLPKVEASVVTVSHDHPDHNNRAGVSGSPFVIKEPGEYEVAGFSLEAISAFHDAHQGSDRGATMIIRVQTSEHSFAHFGDIGQSELSPEQIEALGDIDIAFMPVGGTFTVDGKQAAKIVNQLEPSIVIPIHYKIEGLTIEGLSGPEEFFEAMGQKPLVIGGEWKVKATDLPSEGTRIIQL